MVPYDEILGCPSSPKAGMKQPPWDPESLAPLSPWPRGQNIQRLQFAFNKERLDSGFRNKWLIFGLFSCLSPFPLPSSPPPGNCRQHTFSSLSQCTKTTNIADLRTWLPVIKEDMLQFKGARFLSKAESGMISEFASHLWLTRSQL